MSMTRDEIIEAYESAVFSSGLSAAAGNEEAEKDYELLKAGLNALRDPTREMVERMRGEWEWLGPCRDNKGVSWGTCSVCKTRQRLGDRLSFCPACGAPTTGEAVDIVMRRLEALKDGSETD